MPFLLFGGISLDRGVQGHTEQQRGRGAPDGDAQRRRHGTGSSPSAASEVAGAAAKSASVTASVAVTMARTRSARAASSARDVAAAVARAATSARSLPAVFSCYSCNLVLCTKRAVAGRHIHCAACNLVLCTKCAVAGRHVRCAGCSREAESRHAKWSVWAPRDAGDDASALCAARHVLAGLLLLCRQGE